MRNDATQEFKPPLETFSQNTRIKKNQQQNIKWKSGHSQMITPLHFVRFLFCVDRLGNIFNLNISVIKEKKKHIKFSAHTKKNYGEMKYDRFVCVRTFFRQIHF